MLESILRICEYWIVQLRSMRMYPPAPGKHELIVFEVTEACLETTRLISGERKIRRVLPRIRSAT